MVNLTAGASAANIDASRGQYTFSAWLASYTENPEQPYLTVQFLDANTNQVGGTVIFDRVNGLFFTRFADGVTTFDSDAHLHSWAKYVKTGAIPPLARMARVGIQHSPNSSLSGGPDTYVDLVKLDVSVADTRPSVDAATPGGSGVPANTSINVTLRDGFFTVNTNTIAFRFDGTPVTAAISKAGPLTSIQYAPGLLSSGSSHNYQVSYSDSGPGAPQTNSFSFTVATYATLPTSYAKPSASASTRGFTFRTVAPLLGTTLPSTLARARAQLDGTLIDPFTGLPHEKHGRPGPNPDGPYSVDGPQLDDGSPGLGQLPDNNRAQAVGRKAFSSEDRFILICRGLPLRCEQRRWLEVSTGNPPQGVFGPLRAGLFDNGRGRRRSVRLSGAIQRHLRLPPDLFRKRRLGERQFFP
jgi:hypothetical protein